MNNTRNRGQIFNLIATQIVPFVDVSHVNIFLCGAASSKLKTSTRDNLKDHLTKDSTLKILYPEVLFSDILIKNKKSNLLTLERLLADNSDFICVIVESYGSAVELGAFVNNKDTFNKVIAVIHERHKKDKSFIMLGPIKLLSSNNKYSVVYYNDKNISELAAVLSKIFKFTLKSKKKSIKDFKYISKEPLNLFKFKNLYSLIPIILYFFKSINSVELYDEIIKLVKNQTPFSDDESFKTTFDACIKMLFKERIILSSRTSLGTIYSLTNKGLINTKKLLDTTMVNNKNKLFDEVRFSIIELTYY